MVHCLEGGIGGIGLRNLKEIVIEIPDDLGTAERLEGINDRHKIGGYVPMEDTGIVSVVFEVTDILFQIKDDSFLGKLAVAVPEW